MPLGLGQSSVFSLMLPRQFDLEPVNVLTLSLSLRCDSCRSNAMFTDKSG